MFQTSTTVIYNIYRQTINNLNNYVLQCVSKTLSQTTVRSPIPLVFHTANWIADGIFQLKSNLDLDKAVKSVCDQKEQPGTQNIPHTQGPGKGRTSKGEL